MKILLLFISLLLGSCAVRPSAPTRTFQPSTAAQIGTRSIMVFVPDSVERTYSKLLTGLTRAGYPLPTLSHKREGKAVTFSTKPKTVSNVAGLALQVVIEPSAQGSMVTFMGKCVLVDSLGQAERDSRKWKWISYGVPNGNLPTQAFWDDMARAAVECFPGARMVYL